MQLQGKGNERVQMASPFSGIRVIDLTHVLAGPFCTYQLALLGADVIKVERPGSPDCTRGRGPDDNLNAAGMGLTYQVQGANKRACAIDLSDQAGREIFLRLVETADVIVENFRTGSLAAYGLDATTLCANNPGMIYCSLTGFGHLGARAERNAYDNVIQAASGIMDRTGGADAPPRKAGASFVDYTAGLNAAFAIAAALMHREREGKGQIIDCAMLDAALITMAPELSAALHQGPHTKRPAEAGLGCYQTAEGHITLGAFNLRQNTRLWQALGHPEFAALDSWEALWSEADAMRHRLGSILLTRTAAEWEDFFARIRVPAERVRSLDEASRMPHLAERGFVRELAYPTDPANSVHVPLAAFRYRSDGPAITRPPPAFGQHTRDVLNEIGYTDAEIESFLAAGIIA